MKKKNEKKDENDIEIVMGDKKDLEISEAKTCVNTLRPKDKKEMEKKVVVPKGKNEDK